MSLLEIIGIIFLGIIIINLAIGIWAVKMADKKEDRLSSALRYKQQS
jgi:hypothetical protein